MSRPLRVPPLVHPSDSKSEQHLAILLRGVGCLDLLALLAVVMPRHWMDVAHKFVGLGTFPDGPIVGYLARSTSALYALHGAMVLFMSFDVARHARLIRFMAVAALVHGAVILGIDLAEGCRRRGATVRARLSRRPGLPCCGCSASVRGAPDSWSGAALRAPNSSRAHTNPKNKRGRATALPRSRFLKLRFF